MALLAVVALTTLVANAASRLRVVAVAFLAVSVAASAIAASATTRGQLGVILAAGIAASGILFVAARDGAYGEDPRWRTWVATIIAVAATPAAYFSFRTVTEASPAVLPPPADAGVILQVAAFWLITSGIATLVTARGAVRASLGALLMLTGVQLLMRDAPGPQLELTIAVAWVELVVALTGAFLIVNERARLE